MRVLLRLLFAGIGVGGLFTAIGVSRVEPGTVSASGHSAGLHLAVSGLDVRPSRGRVVFGPPGSAPRLAVKTKDERTAELSLTVEWHVTGSVPPAPAELEAALREGLAKHYSTLTLRELTEPVTTEQAAEAAVRATDAALETKKVVVGWVGVHDVRVPPEDDAKLRAELLGTLRTAVEEARAGEAGARKAAAAVAGKAGETIEAMQTRWDIADGKLRAELGGVAAEIRAETDDYVRRREAEAEGVEARMVAEGALALARAAAERDRATAEALQGDAGRLYTAIEAARRFKAGELDPALRSKLTTMAAWRAFFLR